MNRIVVSVNGGCVDAVYVDIGINPTDPQKVVILDWDNNKAGDEWDSDQEKVIEDLENGQMSQIY